MLPDNQKQPETEAVPVTAQDHARQVRKRGLLWGMLVAALGGLLLGIWYFSSKPVEARNYLGDARQHFDMGKYSDALTELNLAERQARRPEVYRLRVATYRALDRPRDAYQDVSKLIQMEPGVLEHYRLRAQLALEFGDVEKASKDYTVLIERHQDPAAYTGRAMCYRRLGDTARMLADLTESVRLAPSVENLLQRGLAYAAAGDYRKALADYDGALAINPAAGQVYRARAYARGVLGDKAGEQQDTRAALKLEAPEAPPESKFPER
jgi:tetratricopeptide (TPR) repeat protein